MSFGVLHWAVGSLSENRTVALLADNAVISHSAHFHAVVF